MVDCSLSPRPSRSLHLYLRFPFPLFCLLHILLLVNFSCRHLSDSVFAAERMGHLRTLLQALLCQQGQRAGTPFVLLLPLSLATSQPLSAATHPSPD